MKFKSIIKLAVVITTLTMLIACYYDNQDELYNLNVNNTGSGSCDTSNITWTGTIQAIVSGNCQGCHGSTYATTGGNINLQTSADVQAAVTGNGLITSISGSSPNMPKNASPLSSCQVNQFIAWKNQGFH